jgi:Sugar-binding N-terminal domain
MMEPGQWILSIADDLTGALEAGAKFAGRGLGACVTTKIAVSGPPDVPVLVIDTETRHLAAEKARAVVRDAAESAMRFAPWLVTNPLGWLCRQTADRRPGPRSPGSRQAKLGGK